MRRIKNEEVIKIFVEGEKEDVSNHEGNLYTIGDKLCIYNEVIASRDEEGHILIYNIKYNKNGVKIINKLKELISEGNYPLVGLKEINERNNHIINRKFSKNDISTVLQTAFVVGTISWLIFLCYIR
ncbi:hypothetical protein B7C51_25015 (plasmid) [Paenibacillus larvae subsp. pulvifaciens]|uniref:Uncharacterized protein n=1 Tax=Paenibacillus larvae subsp. pulvifaciens TaxID=1477 RepID=A0A1V0V007_9BACL|nr:hypothetical protein [Paenibacillus larvae]ARF70736.1 hypothetical protein B7C51_25015 [Paenibacillus larvae subsp. pulvifaciens]